MRAPRVTAQLQAPVYRDLADEWAICDNSETDPILLAEYEGTDETAEAGKRETGQACPQPGRRRVSGYLVDAGVVVKRLMEEDHREEAVRLPNGGSIFVAAALVFAEVANALPAMRRRGGMGRRNWRMRVWGT